MLVFNAGRGRHTVFVTNRRFFASANVVPVISIPRNSVAHAFGAFDREAVPLFETGDIDFTVNPGESWGIVGRGKDKLFQTLLGHTRVRPTPQGGLYPSMQDVDPFPHVKFVPFRHSQALSSGGGFYDYTAKYGALREGDEKRLSESLQEVASESSLTADERTLILKSLGLLELLSVPLVGLSNGQMRRARITRALFKCPRILLLDEPLTGLDVESRKHLIELLYALRDSRTAPRILSSFRTQEVVKFSADGVEDIAPEVLTHLLYIEGNDFWAGPRKAFFDQFARRRLLPLDQKMSRQTLTRNIQRGRTVMHLKDVNVQYAARHVLKDINWEIKQGDRWHLQGTNGSGKTTLLSLLTGDHPQSFSQDHLLLPAPSPNGAGQGAWQLRHRKQIATTQLQSCIGVLSPELFDAFPRRYPGMSVWDAVQTGFHGTFVAPNRGLGRVHVDSWEQDVEKVKEWRTARMWKLLEQLGPAAWDSDTPYPSNAPISEATRDFAAKSFTGLSPGEQRVVLLMRALVGRPPIVILDEAWSGMEERMIRAVKAHFDDEEHGLSHEQAVILITHWDTEVPWTTSQGLQRFRLEEGRGHVHLD